MISIGIHTHLCGFEVVELTLENQSLQLKNSHRRVFEPDSTQQGVALIEHLQSLEKKYKNQPLRFCYSLPQNEVSSFFISLPFKEKFKILKTLPFEIEEQSPFNPHQVFYDARISSFQDKKSKILCFATPKNNVHNFVKTIKPIKTEPYLLSVEASALANMIEDWNLHKLKSEKNKLYIHIGFSETIVLFFHEGSLENISTIDWGLAPIIDKIVKKYKLSFEEAVEEFLTKSFVLSADKGFSKDQIQFSAIIKEELAGFIHQFNLLNISYSNNQVVNLDQCFLLGPGAAIKNLSAFLTMETSHSFSKVKSIPHLSSFDFSDSKNYSFSIALGLAMEGFKRAPHTAVNFLSFSKKESFMLFSKKIYTALGIGLIAAALLFGLSFIRHKETRSLNDKIDYIFKEYVRKIMFKKASEVDVDSVKDYLKNKTEIRKIEKIINQKIQKTNAIQILETLSRDLQVKKAWDLKLTYFKIDSSKLFIQGELKASFLAEFKNILKNLSQSELKQWSNPNQSKVEATKFNAEGVDADAVGADVAKDANAVTAKNAIAKDVNSKSKEAYTNFSYQFQLKGVSNK